MISYLLKLAYYLLWQITVPLDTSFDDMMEPAFIQAITILYKYFYIWELDLRFNNINHQLILPIIYHYYLLILNIWITIKLFKFQLLQSVSSLFCNKLSDIVHTRRWKSMGLVWRYIECVNSMLDNINLWNNLGFSLCAMLSVCYMVITSDE